MTVKFGFVWLFFGFALSKVLRWSFFFVGETSSVFKKANLVSMSKAISENDKNVSAKIVATNFEKKLVLKRFLLKPRVFL